MKRVYLDNAATTPISKEIIELMSSLMKHQFANPSSTHSEGRKSKTIVEESRSIIAKILNTDPRNIFFTSGGTESDTMAIKMSIENYKEKLYGTQFHPEGLESTQKVIDNFIKICCNET